MRKIFAQEVRKRNQKNVLKIKDKSGQEEEEDKEEKEEDGKEEHDA